MDTKRLQELAGMQLNEADNKEYMRTIKTLARVIIEMAYEDAESVGHSTSAETKEEYANNLTDYVDDAIKDLNKMVNQLKG